LELKNYFSPDPFEFLSSYCTKDTLSVHSACYEKTGKGSLKNTSPQLITARFKKLPLFLELAKNYKPEEFPQRLFFDLKMFSTLNTAANRKISAVG
jgi:hypothetical protein